MMTADPRQKPAVSVMVFTLNEEIHLPNCLASLTWCNDVVVVDCYSTDGTEETCKRHGVRFFQHPFSGFGEQRNWALANIPTKHNWILILDADERVTAELVAELAHIARMSPEQVGAYRVKRRFHIWGRWLRHSSLYPSWVVRFVHKDCVRFVNRGHAETQAVQGAIHALTNDLLDENLKGIDEWFERQNRYSTRDAEFELIHERAAPGIRSLFSLDPLARRAYLKALGFRLPFRPLLYFLYAYVLRGGILDGRDGFVFCTMKATYYTMVNVKKYDMRKRLTDRGQSNDPAS